jgi:hypothetical protein
VNLNQGGLYVAPRDEPEAYLARRVCGTKARPIHMYGQLGSMWDTPPKPSGHTACDVPSSDQTIMP